MRGRGFAGCPAHRDRQRTAPRSPAIVARLAYRLPPMHGLAVGDAVAIEIGWARRYVPMRIHFARPENVAPLLPGIAVRVAEIVRANLPIRSEFGDRAAGGADGTPGAMLRRQAFREDSLAASTAELMDALRARGEVVDSVPAIAVGRDPLVARAPTAMERSRQIRARPEQVDSQLGRIEQIAMRMSRLPAVELASGNASSQECARLNRMPFAAGYLDGVRRRRSHSGSSSGAAKRSSPRLRVVARPRRAARRPRS